MPWKIDEMGGPMDVIDGGDIKFKKKRKEDTTDLS